MHRQGFRHVVDINQRMVDMLTRAGADKAVDMDELLKREALDVIGQQNRALDKAASPEHADALLLLVWVSHWRHTSALVTGLVEQQQHTVFVSGCACCLRLL